MATSEELQMRVEAQDVVTGWVVDMMTQNNVPPHIMEDALVCALNRVSKFVMVELANSIMENGQDNSSAANGQHAAQHIEAEVEE